MTTKTRIALCWVAPALLVTAALNVTYQLGYRHGSREAWHGYQGRMARLMTTKETGALVRGKVVEQPNRGGNAIPMLIDNKVQSQ